MIPVLWGWLPLLAEGEKIDPTTAMFLQYFPFLLMAVVFFLLILRPQMNEQKKRQALLQSLKKNDRVLTSGGIIGTIANFSADGREVTLKVDEGKIRVLRRAIEGPYGAESEGESTPPATS